MDSVFQFLRLAGVGFVMLSPMARAQTTVYTEDFQGAHGWTLNVATGPNGADPNFWVVSDAEGGVAPPGCGATANGNRTLHVTSVFNPTGGAAYDAGGLCGLLFCPQTNARAESPAFSTLGQSNLTLTFNYIANGDALNDNASVLYDAGGGWTVLNPSIKSVLCGSGTGQWTQFSMTLPAAANNQPSVKIGFNWTNNDDGVGTDPSVAIDNLVVTAPATNTVPGAPGIGTATAGNASATVAFTPPASNGGSVITGYTATSSPGNLSSVGCTASPCTVNGLVNGTAYTFTVIATNAVGPSLPSAPSNSVTPASVPGAPTIGVATAGNASATVAFTPPASNGGSVITGYTATSSPGNLSSTGCTASPCTVNGLVNGTAYTFTVTATNAVGPGLPSAPSNSVTPASVPGAPTIGVATAGNASATVAFTPPASTGGSAITGYTATSSPGNLSSTGCTASPCTVNGLVNGTAYTFTVTATNAVGPSLPSSPSNSVTPAGVPGAPTIGVATGGNASATVAFTPPASNGGSVITVYTATSSPGNLSSTGCTASPCTVNGLVNGTAYTFTVTATNAVGPSLPSSPSNSVTPAGVPGAPGSVQASASGSTGALVSWTPPASNGGTAITSYTATSQPGGLVCTSAGTPPANNCQISGLTPGVRYVFSVVATNAAGSGAATVSAVLIPAGVAVAIPALGVAGLLLLASLLAGLSMVVLARR